MTTEKPKTIIHKGIEYKVLNVSVGGDYFVVGDKGKTTLLKKEECTVVSTRCYQADF